LVAISGVYRYGHSGCAHTCPGWLRAALSDQVRAPLTPPPPAGQGARCGGSPPWTRSPSPSVTGSRLPRLT